MFHKWRKIKWQVIENLAEQQIREQVEDYKITLKERKKKSETILASDIGYHYVSNGEVLKCQKSQMYALWFVNYFKPTTYEFEAAVQFEDLSLIHISEPTRH